MDYEDAASSDVEAALCSRLEEIRLSRNITQAELAKLAGVSRSTVTRMTRPDQGISLDSFIRLLQALDLADNLSGLLPDQSVRPVDRVREKSYQRKRARRSTKQPADTWTWNDPDNKA